MSVAPVEQIKLPSQSVNIQSAVTVAMTSNDEESRFPERYTVIGRVYTFV